MLSDSERRRLEELEASLSAEDPSLARTLTSGPQRATRRRRVAAIWIAVTATAAVVIGLGLGSVVTVVIALCALGVAAGVWLAGPHR